VRLGQEFVAETVTLGAEREHGRRRQRPRRQHVARRVECNERAAPRLDRAEVVNRDGEVQAGAATQRIWVPRVLAPGAHHSRGAGGCRHTNDRAEVAEVSRVFE
jgi:hypothetical protein